MRQKEDRYILSGGLHLTINLHGIKASPWDVEALGMSAYEIVDYSEVALQQALKNFGHYTIKVNPLTDKRMLNEYGFYYCDTLIEPYCTIDKLRAQIHCNASISKEFDSDQLLQICDGAFNYGRFHRDFNVNKTAANLRYENWLNHLISDQQVFALYWGNELAGFVAHDHNSLVLHAVSEGFRGKGLAKYWWSEVMQALFFMGHKNVKSSISASNLAALNLYASLGFSFKNPVDVYHRLII